MKARDALWALLLAGCEPVDGDDTGADDSGVSEEDTASGHDTGAPDDTDLPDDTGDDVPTDTGAPDDTGVDDLPDDTAASDEAALVCARWNTDRAHLDEGTWSGSVATCDPGDLSATGRDNTLRQVNLYRWLAGLPPVATSPDRNAGAQACALAMDANDRLSHSPPSSWSCWTADGAEAAGRSNIATYRSVRAVDAYMVDSGSRDTLGHRRWILGNDLGPIGVGGTTGASCLYVHRGSGDAGATFTAWPPPGPVPVDALALGSRTVDDAGWSVQSDTADISGAQVTVTSGGEALPVAVRSLPRGYGSRYAVAFDPVGWEATPGNTYRVDVGGSFSYEVEVVDCGR